MTHHLPERLQTDRLVLRAPRAADTRTLFDAYTQDADVARYMVWRPHSRLAETEAFVQQCLRSWESGLGHPYILAKPDRELEAIGMLEARILQHTVDIGYVLARAHWGQGLMPEAVAHLTRTALENTRFYRVQATCDVDNQASARTLEKAGFIREARLERYLVHPNLSSEPRPCFMYARCR
ncbi:GNAT family N-acetyltransferase [Aquabacterium sp. A7-Y]|uniref:GNAT family N-acetyltransferase n=1 Tax=Aquabacterium sp. A7-Y TaxID=1349605 RepID=UPI00223DA3E9|nr:GNAT family N-acetyltransferase [Aquabacterium sp. A7-Y]MCW7538044.1 GNAT family N-acetyltransferase [Aquabacterium sp. A7-Y]